MRTFRNGIKRYCPLTSTVFNDIDGLPPMPISRDLLLRNQLCAQFSKAEEFLKESCVVLDTHREMFKLMECMYRWMVCKFEELDGEK